MGQKPTYEQLVKRIQELEASEEFLNTIIEHIPALIFVKDAKYLKFMRFNKSGEKLKGTSEGTLLGKTDYDVFPEKEADGFVAKDREALNTNTIIDIPEEIIRVGNNQKRLFHTRKIPIMDKTGKPIYLLGISEDITERKKLQEQLLQAQKMESIGRLAGGVAHDFNNMLAVIIGNTDMALAQTNQDMPLYKRLMDIRKAAERSAQLTSQLLAFARKQIAAPKILNLSDVLTSMVKMLRILIGERIELLLFSEKETCLVKMDPSQVDQILVNLCINARDAIADTGRITIETKNMSFDPSFCANHPEYVPGDFVMLSVTDNGEGMNQDTLKKIFEPFFSTKKANRGTGLGLATVYGIINQNGGFIHVDSEPGRGTTFCVYLPRQKTSPPAGVQPIRLQQPLEKGHETILLVEDEQAILSMASKMLEQFGYHVMAHTKPKDAITAASHHQANIDLLITDVIMPEMNGPMLEEAIRVHFPKIKCLFMSGYTDNVIAHHGVLDEGVNFIQKPFFMDELAAKVRAVLDQKREN